MWRDLSPDEVTWRPHEDFSAIGWHLGHQAHVARFVIRNLTAAEPSPDPATSSCILTSETPGQLAGWVAGRRGALLSQGALLAANLTTRFAMPGRMRMLTA